MVTVITATGSPIMLPSAVDARVIDGRLVCLDASGVRLLSFDPLDVTAYAVETPGQRAEWLMGGPALLNLGASKKSSGPMHLFSGRARTLSR